MMFTRFSSLLHMSISIYLKLLCFTLVAFITACGGGSDDLNTGSTVADELSLASVEFEGGSLEGVFDPERVGIYQVNLNEGETALSITAVLESVVADDARIVTFSGGGDFLPSVCRNIDGDIAGEEPAVEIFSGTGFTLEIDEGTNIIVIRVASAEFEQCIDYRFQVFREFSVPLISSLAPLSSAFTFDSEVFDYDITVPYSSCSFGLSVIPNSPSARVTINDERVANGQLGFTALEAGVTQEFPIVLTLPDGTSSTYTFNVTRENPEGDELESDSRLSDISLSDNGRLLSAFNCLSDLPVGAQVNSTVEEVEITATTAVEGATVVAFQLGLIDEGSDDEPESITVGDDGVFTVPLELGTNIVTVTVGSVNLNNFDSYTLLIQRTERDWTYASTAEELQAALQLASPNQEIVVLTGDYDGVASLEASGSETAHFYTEQSGTTEEPIILRALVPGTVTLFGDDLSQNTVLQVSGDYWQISDLELQAAQTGLLLDAASNNVLHNMDVSQVGQRGVHIRNGSSDNALSQFSITDTGLALNADSLESMGEALVIGSDDLDWASAPVPGSFNEADLNNRVFDFELGPDVPSELVDIKEGSEGTELAYSTFNSTDIVDAEDNALIVIKGNTASIHNNRFEHTASDFVDHLIATRDASEDFHTIDWGENAEIFSNIFDITADDSSVILSAETSAVGVAENLRTDEAEVIYSGEGVDLDFDVPFYQVQLVSDPTLCMSPGIVQVTAGGIVADSAQIVLEDCDIADPTKQWRFIQETDGNLTIRNASSELRILPVSVFAEPESLISNTAEVNFGNILDAGLILRWLPIFVGSDIQLVAPVSVNRAASNAAIIVALTGTTPNELVTSEIYVDQDQNILALLAFESGINARLDQRFQLIEIE